MPTASAVILTPVVLPIVPKVEFNFEVIMYITILFLNSKKLLSAIVIKTYLKALRSSCFRDDCMKKNFFTSKVCRHFFTYVDLQMLFVCTDNFAGLPEHSRVTTKPVICSSLMIHDREMLARLTTGRNTSIGIDHRKPNR